MKDRESGRCPRIAESLARKVADVVRSRMTLRDGFLYAIGICVLRMLDARSDPKDSTGDAACGQYVLPRAARWAYLLSQIGDQPVVLRGWEAVSHRKENAELAWIMQSLDLTRGTSTPGFSEVTRTLLELVNELDLSANEWARAMDTLVDTLIEGAGGTTAEFYTPADVGDLMVSLLAPQPGSAIYDPTCGTGGLLVRAYGAASRVSNDGDATSLFGQEVNSWTAALAKLRLIAHGLPPGNIAVADTLRQPAFLEGNTVRKFDYVIADLPLGLRMRPEVQNELDSDRFGRMRYGAVGFTADLAFTQHVASSMSKAGRAVLLTLPSVLFGAGAKSEVRRQMLNDHLINSVVSLPSGVLPNTSVSPVLLILARNPGDQKERQIVFVRASVSSGRAHGSRKLSPAQTERIVAAVADGKSENGFCASADADAIAKADYSLDPSRYLQPERPSTFLGVAVKWRTLGEIAEVSLGTKLDRSLLESNTQNGIPVLRGADLSADLTVAGGLMHTPADGLGRNPLLLESGDVLVQRIGGAPKVRVADEQMKGVLALDTLYVLRLRPEQHHLSNFLAEYLNSDTGRGQLFALAVGSAAPSIRLVDLRRLPVPIPPPRVVETIESVGKAEMELRQRLETAKEIRQQLLNSSDAEEAEGLLRRLGALTSVVTASAAQAEDFDFQLRNYYPLPLAYPYRLLEAIDVPAEKYQELMRVCENTLAYLASIGLSMAVSFLPKRLSEHKHLGHAALQQCWRGGISPGDWITVGRETARLLRGETKLSAIESFSGLWFRGTGNKQSKFGEIVSDIGELINDFKHGRGPKNEPQYEEAGGKAGAGLREILGELSFLIQGLRRFGWVTTRVHDALTR
jgi:type I restriction enzyme M protein